MVFLSKSKEQEWNDMPDWQRNTLLHILEKNVYETQCKIQKELEDKIQDESEDAFRLR